MRRQYWRDLTDIIIETTMILTASENDEKLTASGSDIEEAGRRYCHDTIHWWPAGSIVMQPVLLIFQW